MTTGSMFSNEEGRWSAVLGRDRTAEGFFYYAVRTTGIYCRPGCPSRLPRREHVRFFRTSQEALRAGYRPCKRCKPDSAAPHEGLSAIIIQACRSLEQADTPPPLEQLAAQAGLSPWHFQRRFKAAVGVTPKQYATARQAERLRDRLMTQPSVTEAIYDAGFGSSSRAYTRARDHMAMPPSTYQKGAKGLMIRYGVAPCFLGWVAVAATDRGICAIEFGDDPSVWPAQLQARFPHAHLEEAGPDFTAIITQVTALLEAPEQAVDLPLDIQGTAFQQRVWSALRAIPPGVTASYTDIANRIGSPASVRAVAQACAANKLAVVIPCHRVVRNGGNLSGYRWGVERKRALLVREAERDG